MAAAHPRSPKCTGRRGPSIQLSRSGVLAKHMHEHPAEIKESIEARARKSKLFPQQACDHEIGHALVLVEENR
jgi:hypothetical protein